MERIKFKGMSYHPLYPTWNGMIDRCHNEKSDRYIRYGRRGISVCDRWRYNFLAFIQDMGDRPYGCSLDRIDNNGNYEPDNCRWATREAQDANRRNPNEISLEERELLKNRRLEKNKKRKILRDRLKVLSVSRIDRPCSNEKDLDKTISHLNKVIVSLKSDQKKAKDGIRILPILNIPLS